MGIFTNLFQHKTPRITESTVSEAVEALRYQLNEGAQIFSSDERFERCLLSDEVVAAILGYIMNVSRLHKISRANNQQKVMDLALDALFTERLGSEIRNKIATLMHSGRPVLDQGLLMTVSDAKMLKADGVKLGYLFQLMQEFQAMHPETQTDTEF